MKLTIKKKGVRFGFIVCVMRLVAATALRIVQEEVKKTYLCFTKVFFTAVVGLRQFLFLNTTSSVSVPEPTGVGEVTEVISMLQVTCTVSSWNACLSQITVHLMQCQLHNSSFWLYTH